MRCRGHEGVSRIEILDTPCNDMANCILHKTVAIFILAVFIAKPLFTAPAPQFVRVMGNGDTFLKGTTRPRHAVVLGVVVCTVFCLTISAFRIIVNQSIIMVIYCARLVPDVHAVELPLAAALVSHLLPTPARTCRRCSCGLQEISH